MPAVKIRKVSAYPIPTTMMVGTETLPGKIAKLTTVGFLIETEKPLGLGLQFSFKFIIPVLGTSVEAVGVVIKTYARYGGEPGKSKSHTLNEIHFKSLKEDDKAAITKFLSSIRQI